MIKTIQVHLRAKAKRTTVSLIAFLTVLTILVPAVTTASPLREVDVYTSGTDGYAIYRIPAIIKTPSGVLLAFCEGRRNGASDSGDIDLVLKRSADNGKTWGPLQMVWDDGENTCGNPSPVVDRTTGKVWLLMTWNNGNDKEDAIHEGRSKDTRRVFVTSSRDDGRTWEKPKEITSTTKKPEWRWYATGPCHAIQLKSGRLVIPANHSFWNGTKAITRTHVIISDDHGKSWRHSEPVAESTNESSVTELDDGRLYINMRSYHRAKCRAFAWSDNKGDSWYGSGNDPVLVEPICQGNVLRHEAGGETLFFFSNPASTKREKMTVRVSRDSCKTWNSGKLINEGPSAYSDLVSLNDETIGLLYECGEKARARITFVPVAVRDVLESAAAVDSKASNP